MSNSDMDRFEECTLCGDRQPTVGHGDDLTHEFCGECSILMAEWQAEMFHPRHPEGELVLIVPLEQVR